MFRKILIANRGEIACRVMRTAKRLGVATVAVYSQADAQAMHVAAADEAYEIGPAAAAESYLKAENIIAVAKTAGADAIHPGYGFLSENAAFVEAVEAAGLTFIGPSAASIRAMGLKDAAKALMEKAGVPVVPGYHGEAQDADFLKEQADSIGYPVLIKARAGGGGKGMRRVDEPEAFEAALQGAQREGQASFGDGRVLIEKYLAKPRHIEVQVFGDSHGNVVHLFERDCSLQRRHQKVVEEAPAPGMSAAMRATMGAAAVKAAEAIDYEGAGTIEFIADVSDGLREDRFFFMEMNTRLQVEHPVTEMITGHDLVEWQLKVAAGQRLPVAQDELSINGWAFEARLYAENPARGFLPSTGTLSKLHLPDAQTENDMGVRVDTGVREGDAITPFYDPMIAKIITHGESREVALGRLQAALADTRVSGTITNAPFLLQLVSHNEFASGDVDTGLIDRHQAELTAVGDVPPVAVAIGALAGLGWPGLASHTSAGSRVSPWEGLGPWRLWEQGCVFTRLEYDAGMLDITATRSDDAGWDVVWRDNDTEVTVPISIRDIVDDHVRVVSGNRTLGAHVVRDGMALTVFLNGKPHVFTLADPLAGSGDDLADGDRVQAPMPGLIKLVSVTAGDAVSKGSPVIVMEAMKMEHTLVAPRDGEVGEILVVDGDQVDEDAVLLVMAET